MSRKKNQIEKSLKNKFKKNQNYDNYECNNNCAEHQSLVYLTNLIEDIITYYQITWKRDRELGYPGYRNAQGEFKSPDNLTSISTTQVIETDTDNVRRDEICRLNAILPKLEDSYIKKVRACWSILVSKLRNTYKTNPRRFEKLIVNIQLSILRHRIHDNGHLFSTSTNYSEKLQN